VGEIIFKLVIFKLILLLISYPNTEVFNEAMEKLRNPYLSTEEKEAISRETSHLAKYWLFNGFM
jgi:hypothetical protein